MVYYFCRSEVGPSMKERLDTLRTEIALPDTYFGFSQHTRKILTRNDDTD